MSKDYVLAIDQGTISTRAIPFDRKGQIKGIAQKEFAQLFDNPGWAEHNPNEILTSTLACMGDVLGEEVHANA